jgi:hypothetical protein
MSQRTNNAIALALMAVVLTTQVIRIGVAIATDDWSNAFDIVTISCLAVAIIFRTLQLGSFQDRAGVR